jgi:hypothetical protein
VEARNLYGATSQQGDYELTVLAPWYREWWGYGLQLIVITVRFDNSGNPTGGFGAVNSAGPGRVLSLGLKLVF